MFLLIFFTLFANPFSIVVELDKINYAADEYYKLDITVRSISRQEGLFLLNIELPKSIELLEGNLSFKDELLKQVQKTFSVIVNPLKEDEGSIKIKLFSYIDELTVDRNKVKTYSIPYLVFKHNDVLVLKTDAAEEYVSKKEKKNIEIKEEKIEKTEISEFKIDSKKNQNTQTFVYVKKTNKLIYLKVFLFFISVGVIIFFIRRIIKNKSN